MNMIRKHWMNVLASVMLANMFACSGNELEQMSNGYESKEPGRAVDLITQTIETDSVGGLEIALKAAMGEEVGTLQKLVIKGPISGDDWGYVRNLYELVEIDMSETKIVGEGSFRYSPYYTSTFIADTICYGMFYRYYYNSSPEFTKLKKVTLPPTIKYIGGHAFHDCDALEDIEIPASVKVIAKHAFAGCGALETITLNEESTTGLKLNEGLTTIEEYAFEQTGLKSVELPASLTSLERYAFYKTPSLTSVIFSGDNLVTIPEYAFYECSALTSVDWPENLETIGRGAFRNCDGLNSITFPESLKTIEYEAFYDCDGLTSITFPGSLETIGRNAFSYGDKLEEIVIPQNVTNIESEAFRGLWSLKSAKVLANITAIPNGMFYECDDLETIELAANIKSLGNDAFRGCLSLKDDTPFANITAVGSYVFQGCGFETFDLSNMTNMGTYTFMNCTQLESVTFPEGVTTIPRQFFDGCKAMTSITLPSTVTKIDYGAFANTGFTAFEVPSTVTEIGSDAFSNSQIYELTIPETVTSVGNYFVNNCENLVAVYWNSPIAVPYNNGTKTCFLYLANDQIAYNRDSWKNVIMGGVAESIVLNEDYVRNRRASKYAVPKRFFAKKISYTRHFDDTTYPGRSSGWQTLTLPFTPTSITHASKGVVAPFNSEVEDAKPFWLRELTGEGFMDVTTIEPNKPYIIAMPYHSDYLEEYRLNGDVTFRADSVYIEATPDALTASIGPNFELHPCYAKTAKSAGVYSLNADAYISGYDYGSVFVRSLDDVYTFEAYVTTLGGGRSSRSLFGTDTHSKATRSARQRNTTGIPQIGDM